MENMEKEFKKLKALVSARSIDFNSWSYADRLDLIDSITNGYKWDFSIGDFEAESE